MKKFLIVLCVTLSSMKATAQQIAITGNWEGELKGVGLRLIFHIADKDGTLTTTMDSPAQNGFGIVCRPTALTGDKLRIDLKAYSAWYEGVIQSDHMIKGSWHQGGNEIELNLSPKVGEDKPVVKPQTPQPPFSYNSEDVEYDNSDKSLHYGATFTYPKGDGPFPTVVLITGSGRQDRDEKIGEHKPFAVIADHLTKIGFAVLRVDDRGEGKSTGDFRSATTLDFANDVEVSLEYCKKRKQVMGKKIGLIGHSEGGMIAPIVAARNRNVAFIVLLAAPGIPIKQLMTEQNNALLASAGVDADAITVFDEMYVKLITGVPSAPDQEVANELATSIFNEWQKKTDPDIVKKTTGVVDSGTADRYVSQLSRQLYLPWYRYFLKYDPQAALQMVACPVLALNGENDLQVIAKPNLNGIREALQKGKCKKYLVKEIPGLNHLFQTSSTGNPSEYFSSTETFSPLALSIMTTWLLEIAR